MELQSSIVNSSSLKGKNIRSCCRPTFLFQRSWLKNKGAILVLIWSLLSFTVYHYFIISNSRDPIKRKTNYTQAEILAMGVLLPIGGWLADAYFGRYRVIRFGMWTMWFGAMINGFSLVIGEVFQIYSIYCDPWVSLACKILMGAGFGAFQANIIQFGIDQLMDASSTEIKSFIIWYTMTTYSSGLSLYFSAYCTPEYVAVLVVAVYLTLAVVSNFLLNHWLNKEQVVSNPLPLVLKVVKFTIKNKTHNHSRQGLLSKFDIAKQMYNGPFSSEQVEDVKTLFRVLAVIGIVLIACSGLPTVNSISFKVAEHLRGWPNDNSINGCYQGLGVFYVKRTVVMVAVLLYVIFIYPIFHTCIPSVSITTKFSYSVLFFFVSIVVLLGIETASYLQQTGSSETIVRCTFQSMYTADINFYWVIIPFVFHGFCSLLIITSGIEFICAQAPFNMKGLIVGIGCALYGLSSLIQVAISFPFMHSNIWERAPLTCGLWYFTLQGLIVLIGFLVVLLMVKLYKRRTRISVSTQEDSQDSDMESE